MNFSNTAINKFSSITGANTLFVHSSPRPRGNYLRQFESDWGGTDSIVIDQDRDHFYVLTDVANTAYISDTIELIETFTDFPLYDPYAPNTAIANT